MNETRNGTVLGAFTTTPSRIATRVLEANRRMATALSPVPPGTTRPQSVEPEEDRPEWDVDAPDGDVDALGVGDSVRFGKTLTESDVERFAAVSGDTNPVHLDEERAEETRFDGRIVHGTLVSGLVSAALARLPGDVIYLSQEVEFRAPVRVGDRAVAEVEVVEDLDGRRYRLHTAVTEGGDTALDGEAIVLVEPRGG